MSKNADGMANSVEPDQTAPTVRLDLSVGLFRITTLYIESSHEENCLSRCANRQNSN